MMEITKSEKEVWKMDQDFIRPPKLGPFDSKAKVVVVNQTGQTVLSTAVAHKYSNVFKDNLQWENLAEGAGTQPQEARYQTGLTALGADWWLVSWVTMDGRTHYTAPNNLTWLLDFLTPHFQEIATSVSMLFNTLAMMRTKLIQTPTALAISTAANITKLIASNVLNDEKVEGFKEYMLRAEDAGQTLTITLCGDGTVTFQSPSGKESTGSAVMDALAGEG
ncbi:MAG: hypothetical protein Q4C72_05110 [Eubacteriales bacterium]|nr:hypothetical protein [Eubacteriales bacterium]